MPRKLIVLYTLMGAGTLLMAIMALVFNIKTIPLAKQSSELTQAINTLKEDNQSLYYELSSQTTYEKIQKKAVEIGLKQMKPYQMNHIQFANATAKP